MIYILSDHIVRQTIIFLFLKVLFTTMTNHNCLMHTILEVIISRFSYSAVAMPKLIFFQGSIQNFLIGSPVPFTLWKTSPFAGNKQFQRCKSQRKSKIWKCDFVIEFFFTKTFTQQNEHCD